MFRKLVIGALGAMAVLFSTTAFAQGTAADAKAMLERTVAAIKADKAKTLDQINKGEKDRKSTRLNSSHRSLSRMPSSA